MQLERGVRIAASASEPDARPSCENSRDALARAPTVRPELPEALSRLRDELAGLRLDLETADVEGARATRDDIVAQTDDYLLPRLEQMDAPVLMVVGGSTGAGKSTIVNSFVGAEVSPSGVLRPTTRGPVLVCHPDDLRWFEDDRILPGLPRATGGEPTPGTLLLTAVPQVPLGLALVDAPDIDSVLKENRVLATQLLAAADAWLFVTTAARYADAVPWDFLATARERGTALSIILNRVPEDAEREVTAHLGEMIRERGIDAVLLVVAETQLQAGRLPQADLAPVRHWLDALAADAQARADLVRRTLTGALRSLPGRAGAVERAAAEQLAAAADLRAQADLAYASARQEVEDALRSGSLLRGEVLARWHEVVGTGELMRELQSRLAAIRDRLASVLTGREVMGAELREAVEHRLEAVVQAAAERAAERAALDWGERSAGRALVDFAPGLTRASEELRADTREQVRAWQASVMDLVRTEGAARRTTARLASLGVNGAGFTVMLAVFASTGGITGLEAVVAGGTSAVGHTVLEALLGDQAVRALAARARDDLLERVDDLLRDEGERFAELLEGKAPEAGAVARLHTAINAVRRAS
ncbi:MAG: putative transporter [Gaiellaceae bacterium]|nr:putative transporter [Gaiellaceae bacterium]